MVGGHSIRDPELTQLEDVTAKVSFVAWLASVASMITLLVHHPISSQGRIATIAVIVGCAADFNRADGITVQDIFDFLSTWFAGCP